MREINVSDARIGLRVSLSASMTGAVVCGGSLH